MEETYNLKAVVLNRRPFSEDDGRVTVYSLERGKLELTVRGVKKIKSKLAGHLEPFCLSGIMAVAGRQYDYVGAAVSENCFLKLKGDLAKLTAAGQAIKIFDKLIRPGVADEAIFALLLSYLEILNENKPLAAVLNALFVFKLLAGLGHKPQLDNCVNCGGKLSPLGIKFDPARGGLLCSRCPTKGGMSVSESSVKLLRLAATEDLKKLIKIKLDKKTGEETDMLVKRFFDYHF